MLREGTPTWVARFSRRTAGRDRAFKQLSAAGRAAVSCRWVGEDGPSVVDVRDGNWRSVSWRRSVCQLPARADECRWTDRTGCQLAMWTRGWGLAIQLKHLSLA